MPETREDLSDWRRTYYSTDVTPTLDGKEVTVFGRIVSIREQGGITFIILQDMRGITQVTIHKDRSPQAVLEKAKDLAQYSVVGIKGSVKSMTKAPHGAELIPSDIRVLDKPQKRLPFDPHGRVEQSIDKRLDLRVIDLLRPQSQAIFRIRSVVLEVMRQFLQMRALSRLIRPR